MDEHDMREVAREAAEDKLITEAFQHLLDTYLASRHRKKVDIITKAFNFARQAHKGVRRLSGEPYIMHPIAVAQIAWVRQVSVRRYYMMWLKILITRLKILRISLAKRSLKSLTD